MKGSRKPTATRLLKQVAPVLAARSKERSKGICNWYRHQDYARLSYLAYEFGSSLTNAEEHMTKLKIDDCYTVVPDLSSEDHVVFQNKVDGHGVIAYRGTDTNNNGDLIADAHILFGLEEYSFRFANATAVATQAMRRFGEGRVRVTGHSLGGTQALHVSKKFDLQAYVFNPGAGATLGLQDFLSGLGKSVGAEQESMLVKSLTGWLWSGKTKSYIFTTCWDPVSIAAFYKNPRVWSGYEIIPHSTNNFRNPHALGNFMYDYESNLSVGQEYFLALEAAITDAYAGHATVVIDHVDQSGSDLNVFVRLQPKGRWSRSNQEEKDRLARGNFKNMLSDPGSNVSRVTTFMDASVVVQGAEEDDRFFFSFFFFLVKIVGACAVAVAVWSMYAWRT